MIKSCLTRSYVMVFSITILLMLTLTTKAMALDVTASSCSAADIQSAINSVANGGGGTVTLPVCDKDAANSNGALWLSGSKICIASTAEIRVVGQGQGLTKIGYADGATPGYASVSCPGGNGSVAVNFPIAVKGIGIKEISQFTFDANAASGVIYWLQCMGSTAEEKRACSNANTGARLHHVTLNGMASSGRGVYFCQNWRGVTLFDHITIANTENVAGIYGISVNGGWEQESFEVPPAFGSNNGLFVEDSIFDGLYHPIAGFYANRLTARHNTFQNSVGATTQISALEGHGAGFTSGCEYGDPVEFNGTYRYEIYDNSWTAGGGVYYRSGFWIVTDNDFGSTALISSLPESQNFAPARTNCTISAGCPWDYSGYTTSESCFQTPRAWAWNNSNSDYSLQTSFECDRAGTDTNTAEYLTRAPQTGDKYYAGGAYVKYTYPHPLTDPNAPTVQIVQPTSNSTHTTTDPLINLSGTASDTQGANPGIVSVTCNNDRGGNCACTGTTNWNCNNIPLQSGQNIITVTATDGDSKTGIDTLIVTVSTGGGDTGGNTGGGGGDSSASGGSGCGFVKNDSNRESKGQSIKAADIGLMIVLILILAGISLAKRLTRRV